MQDFQHLNYSELVGLVGERNRPSGGIKSIHEVVVECGIDLNTKVLEIGSNTGFSSVQIARLSGASVDGVDINAESIALSKEYALAHGVADRVTFHQVSAVNLPFTDAQYDVVWASNTTSFIEEKSKAFSEYLRVLKSNGFLVVIPIYYRTTPPNETVHQVSEAIETSLNVYSREDWINMVIGAAQKQSVSVELVYSSEYGYSDQTERIQPYVDEVLQKISEKYSPEDSEALRERYTYFMQLFNENLKYAGYSVLIFQKNSIHEETELFLSYRI